MGFEGTVRHPASRNFRLFFGPFLHAVPLRLGLAEGALAGCALAVPWLLLCLLQGFGCEALASLVSGFRRYR